MLNYKEEDKKRVEKIRYRYYDFTDVISKIYDRKRFVSSNIDF